MSNVEKKEGLALAIGHKPRTTSRCMPLSQPRLDTAQRGMHWRSSRAVTDKCFAVVPIHSPSIPLAIGYGTIATILAFL
jgi:hypothetical protein